jgi:hypothetical protein
MIAVPLYKPEAIFRAWPIMTKGIERVLEFSTGDEDLTLILNRALAGELLIWFVVKDGEYQGFTTSLIRSVGTNPIYKYLVFNHTFKLPQVDQEEFLTTCLDTVEKFAKSNGCNSLKIYSIRPLKKMVKKYGFEPSYVEYVKEI